MSEKTDPKDKKDNKENKPKKAAEPKVKKGKISAPRKQKPAVKIPTLLEFSYDFSITFSLLTGILVALMSLQAGLDLISTTLRAGTAMIIVGFGMYGISWYISTKSLEAAKSEMEQKAKEAAELEREEDLSNSTMEVKA
jgi:hypothetical protein